MILIKLAAGEKSNDMSLLFFLGGVKASGQLLQAEPH